MSDYTRTPYLNLYKPTPDADNDVWGDHLNTNADVLDSTLNGLIVGAGGPWLQISGGTMTGPLTLSSSLIWGSSTAGNYLEYTAVGTPRLRYMVGTNERWSINDSGGLSLNGTGPITGFGTGIGQAPMLTNSGSGFPMLSLSNRIVIRRPSPAVGDFTSLQLDRTSTFTGGSAAQRNSLINLSQNVAAGDATANTPLISVVNTSGNAGGQAIAGLFKVLRNPSSTDFVWAMITDAVDTTGLGSAASGTNNLLAQEVDVEANGPDDRANPMTFGGQGVRRGMHFSAIRYDINNTAQTEVSCALSFSVNNLNTGFPIDSLTNWQSIIGFSPNTQVRQVVDTRGAITPAGSSNPVSAVVMSAGHVVDFNGGPLLTSAPGACLQYRTATQRLYYVVGGVDQWSIDASGTVRAKGTFIPSTTP